MAEFERAKGTKEISSEEKIAIDKVVETLKKIFELYGFQPLETPTLQRYNVLASKYAGGTEILKETFRLYDQGKRELALRYDLSVPLALYVALNPNIKLPFKRYEIGKVFRDGPISTERFREFWQCDVDTVGSYSMLADAELIGLALRVFSELKLDVEVLINNRKILDRIMKYAEIDPENINQIILIIDKLDKIGEKGIIKELKEKEINSEQIEKILNIISIKGSNKDKLVRLKDLLDSNEGINEIEEVLSYVPDATLDISLARGLSYYTGTVFEVRLKGQTLKTSIAAGGRYNKMIGDFLESKTQIPAVGISFGLDRIVKVIQAKEKTTLKVYIIPVKATNEAMSLLKKLRSENINSDMDLMSRGISKNLDYANTLKIPHVVFVGEEEIRQNKFKLRDMKTGKEELLTLQELIKALKNEK